MLTHQIRAAFLKYFAENNHEILPASPLIPQDDETTLLFTNSGMAPFKNWFTGAEQAKFKRVTTVQKCMRAGGKHNDLDNVGHTARHHTFFEMLGNFSFGDYFKAEAIEMAWNFLTRELKLNREKLYITVYAEDDEAFAIWRNLTGFGDEKILRIATNDNFWSMGNVGPCGPCSEIFYDHGEHYIGDKPGTPGADGDRFIEIWNLVFMQYEQQANGAMTKLSKPCIDTGMGLERLAAVLQGVNDNYATDILRKIIEDSQILAQDNGIAQNITAHKVISDHLRSICFLMADGVLPSNEGRGYVLRRIIRRAMRYANSLQASNFALYKLVPTVVREMGSFYSELPRAEQLIVNVLESEEASFQETLKKGLVLLNNNIKNIKENVIISDNIANSIQEVVSAAKQVNPTDYNNSTTQTSEKNSGENKILSGQLAFTLYDTYGFPLDLTEDIARAHGLAVNKQEFELAMEKQREISRANWGGAGGKAVEQLWRNLAENCAKTEFYGYTMDKIEAQVLAIVQDGNTVPTVKAGAQAILVLNQTVCYGESGGQIGDRGEIFSGSQHIAKVEDCRVYAGKLLGHTVITTQNIAIGDKVTISFDHAFRNKIRANHSATHLLHRALRQVLGEHVIQKGSLVTEQKLRFDFAHNKALTAEEINQVEALINAEISANISTQVDHMEYKHAIERGAMALFGEKYADQVRVVALGESVELCGGTHVERSGDIGYCCLVGEQSIASGVRRIEALTGEEAVTYARRKVDIVSHLSRELNCGELDLEQAVAGLIEENKRKEREIQQARLKYALSHGISEKYIESATSGKSEKIHLICKYSEIATNNTPGYSSGDGITEQDAKTIADSLIARHDKPENPALVVVLLTKSDESFILIRLGKNTEKIAKPELKANNIVAELVKKYSARGGGNASLAQCRVARRLQVEDIVEILEK